MKNINFICLSLLVMTTLSGCLKKGEDDPLISLRSRKARVDGEWKVVSSKYTSTYTSSSNPSSNYSEIYTFNGNTFTSVSTVNNIPTTISGTETQKWEFDKDGQYESTRITNGVQTHSEGTWDFNSGIGDAKKKSQITLSQKESTTANVQSTFTGNDINNVYDITELRHKKMVWHYHHTEKDADGYLDNEYEVILESDED